MFYVMWIWKCHNDVETDCSISTFDFTFYATVTKITDKSRIKYLNYIRQQCFLFYQNQHC